MSRAREHVMNNPRRAKAKVKAKAANRGGNALVDFMLIDSRAFLAALP